jgi:hypothetical protein
VTPYERFAVTNTNAKYGRHRTLLVPISYALRSTCLRTQRIQPKHDALIEIKQTYGGGMNKNVLALVRFTGVALLLLASVSARAQFNASLSGTVQDNTQALIPGATVTLTNDATQATRTITSGGTGTYQFNELPPGSYTVKVTAKGFKQNTVSNVAVAAETPRSLNLTMQLGQESQEITVNGELAPLLQTADASIGTTIRTAPRFSGCPLWGATL